MLHLGVVKTHFYVENDSKAQELIPWAYSSRDGTSWMALAHIGVINNDHGGDTADLNLIHLFNTLILEF